MNRRKLLIATLACLLLTGCALEPETTSVSNKSTMSLETSEQENLNKSIGDFNNNELSMTLDIPNEEFQLQTSFGTGDYSVKDWRTTDAKYINLNAQTIGLPEGTEVYIDNVHIDSVILSLYAAFDGIPIDTMDDRTHTSMFPGFPISNSMKYNSVFAVGGYSEHLINGYTSGYSTSGMGYISGYIKESRVTEQTLRNSLVYGNMFQVVWDLWIKKPENQYPYMTSVISEFIIPTEFEQKDSLIRYNGKTFDVRDASGLNSEYIFANGIFMEVKKTEQ
jgi:hypothetical protein